jgi:hypothetical protein
MNGDLCTSHTSDILVIIIIHQTSISSVIVKTTLRFLDIIYIDIIISVMEYIARNEWMIVIVLFSIVSCSSLFSSDGFKSIDPRRFKTHLGDVIGMLITFRSKQLRPIQIFKQLQFSSINGNERRFLSPLRAKIWTGARYPSNITNAGVCPQRHIHERSLIEQYPELYIERLKQRAPSVVFQTEDCLFINMFVPTLGKWTLHYCAIFVLAASPFR